MPITKPWHTETSAAPVVARAQALLARVEACIADNPINVGRFRTFRAELTTALAESESYLRWTLSDWSAAIEFECGCIEARRLELAA